MVPGPQNFVAQPIGSHAGRGDPGRSGAFQGGRGAGRGGAGRGRGFLAGHVPGQRAPDGLIAEMERDPDLAQSILDAAMRSTNHRDFGFFTLALWNSKWQ